jgi:hypothetical protein
MIITRIRRGAVRTQILIKNNLNLALSHRLTGVQLPQLQGRHLALGMLAARVAFAPVPVAVAAEASLSSTSSGDADVPPSTVATAVEFSPAAAQTLQISTPGLASITLGKSLQTQADEAAAAQKAADEAKAKADAAAKAKAAAKKKAAQAAVAQTTAPVIATGNVQADVLAAATAMFGADDAKYIMLIIQHESGFNLNARNPHSGACGIFQANPCSKLPSMDEKIQIAWGMNYFAKRYGSGKAAYEFRLVHGYY